MFGFLLFDKKLFLKPLLSTKGGNVKGYFLLARMRLQSSSFPSNTRATAAQRWDGEDAQRWEEDARST
jgi:hypothetical protein